mgnify:FL=1|tara:strand:- start:641 stop:835 length:195 start_codon:yes stop_codon:yes gene_type:complete
MAKRGTQYKRKSSKRQLGGDKKRKTRKASPWNKHLMSVYREMKKKDKSVKLGDAMKAAKETYKA